MFPAYAIRLVSRCNENTREGSRLLTSPAFSNTKVTEHALLCSAPCRGTVREGANFQEGEPQIRIHVSRRKAACAVRMLELSSISTSSPARYAVCKTSPQRPVVRCAFQKSSAPVNSSVEPVIPYRTALNSASIAGRFGHRLPVSNDQHTDLLGAGSQAPATLSLCGRRRAPQGRTAVGRSLFLGGLGKRWQKFRSGNGKNKTSAATSCQWGAGHQGSSRGFSVLPRLVYLNAGTCEGDWGFRLLRCFVLLLLRLCCSTPPFLSLVLCTLPLAAVGHHVRPVSRHPAGER